MKDARFQMVGIRPVETPVFREKRSWYRGKPIAATVVLGAIVLGCVFCGSIMTKDPTYMDLLHYNEAPGREFLFGTDTLGRDIFSMIWYGGRVSLAIGFAATAVSTAIAVVYGAVSGCGPAWADTVMMRAVEIFLSVPELLMVVFLQSILGKATVVSLSLVIGVTSWMSIAKVVRTEVRQLRGSEYVAAATCMGGGFFYILRRHLAPNFASSIMFMVVMNIRSAMVAEATLSFMGIGLPLEIISWGSMLSLSERAMLTGSWWMILIPGAFLVVTLMCVTDIGNYLRMGAQVRHSNL